MKKILFLGFVAMAVTACSNKMDFSRNELNGDVQGSPESKYEETFEKIFGTPSPDQTWGFGASTSGSVMAAPMRSHRVNPGDNYPQTSTGINANANEWADPNKYYGGWLVPDPLTEGQKLRVQKYFQANPNLTYEDPHFRHFFVQQVYKGGTDVPTTTPETITAANNTTYTSNHMNKLTVGQSNLHLNNYNSADCSETNVLDNGSTVTSGTYHKDKIMLMVNIDDTSCFGYYESGASIQVNNKAALVSAATIDIWAAANGNPGEAVLDKWNRSFMGFDHALKEGADVMDAATAKYNDGPESYNYAMVNGQIVSIDGNNEMTYKGNTIHYANTNTNMYVATEKRTISDSDIQGEYRVEGQYKGKYINYDKVVEMLQAGWTPVKDKNLREWVKIGKSDGYFSDWIVTLSKAHRIGEDETLPSLHVMAEDLSAIEASDFDFNDVVFDVFYVDANTVKIKLLAAGGTLPLVIAEKDGWEVHELFKVSEKCMVNTGTKYHQATAPYSQVEGLAPVELTLTGKTWSKDQDEFAAQVNQQIKLHVYKDGAWFELKAEQGKPACKIATPINIYMKEFGWYPTEYRWPWEKQAISTLFKEWVKNPSVQWYSTKD